MQFLHIRKDYALTSKKFHGLHPMGIHVSLEALWQEGSLRDIVSRAKKWKLFTVSARGKTVTQNSDNNDILVYRFPKLYYSL